MKRKNNEVTLETCKRKYTNDDGEVNLLQTILELQTELNESKKVVTELWALVKTLQSDPELSDESNGMMMTNFAEYCKSGSLEGVKSCNLSWLGPDPDNDDSFNEVSYVFCNGLYNATKNNHAAIVELLTNHIKNPRARKRTLDYVQYYDFHEACLANKYETVKQLLADPDQDEKDKMISSAYYYAFYLACTYPQNKGSNLVQLLLDNVRPELVQEMLSSENYQVFEDACCENNYDTMQLLVDRMTDQTFVYAWRHLMQKKGEKKAYHLLSLLSLETIDRFGVLNDKYRIV